MNINNLEKKFIMARRYRAIHSNHNHLSSLPELAFGQGWDAAIGFAKQVDKAENICEHCGKLLTNDICFDADFVPFCPKCYDKLFKKGGEE